MASAFGRALRKVLRRTGDTVDTAVHQRGENNSSTRRADSCELIWLCIQFVGGLDVIGADKRKVGYYVGLIVSHYTLILRVRVLSNFFRSPSTMLH